MPSTKRYNRQSEKLYRSIRKLSYHITPTSNESSNKSIYTTSYSSCCNDLVRDVTDETDYEEKHVRITEELPLFYNPKSFTSNENEVPFDEKTKTLHKHPFKKFSVLDNNNEIDINMYVNKRSQNTILPFCKRKLNTDNDKKQKGKLSSRTKAFRECCRKLKWLNIKDKIKALRNNEAYKKGTSLVDSLPPFTSTLSPKNSLYKKENTSCLENRKYLMKSTEMLAAKQNCAEPTFDNSVLLIRAISLPSII